jgi:NADPH:quinone reductase-like Zn-dependent oxidoreductase
MPTKIHKVLISEIGDVSKVNVVDAEISDPPAKHVQVKVIYSGFSGADINMRLGIYPLQKKAPLTPGYCLVGEVALNGKGSTKFRPGDLVVCLSIYDAQAELVNLPEKYLIKLPPGLDLQAATALILDWNTAYGMVMHTARVSSGQTVFIHGISGAVGHAIMALSQLQGAHVYGTASERNHEAIRALGATPFTYSNKDWIAQMKGLGGAHAVFDALGFESWDESYSILRPDGGILIGYGGNLNTLTGQPPRSMVWPTVKLMARNYLKVSSRKRANFYFISRDRSTFEPDMNALFDLLKQGKISVPIKAVYNLEDIQEAHRNWGKGSGMGSLLVKVAAEDNL